MMKRIVLIALLACAATAARADEFPNRKAGLWEISRTTTGRPAAKAIQMCIDAATDARMRQAGMDTPAATCSRSTQVRSGMTVTSDSECTMGASKVISHMTMVFDGDVAFHMELKTHYDPPIAAGRAETVVVQDGKWVGACPADMQPGDMILPNGMKINLLTTLNRPR